MPRLSFYDVKGKKKFTSDNFRIVKKGARYFAVATAPSGIQAYRIVSKKDAEKYK